MDAQECVRVPWISHDNGPDFSLTDTVILEFGIEMTAARRRSPEDEEFWVGM